MDFINRTTQSEGLKWTAVANGIKPFFPCLIQSVPKGGFLCSSEHGKLCFEHLEKNSGAQNNLPLQGAEKDLRSRLFV